MTTSDDTKNKAVGGATLTASTSDILNLNNTSVSNQRAIILHALKSGPKTTIELRYEYGIMQPAQRISELKNQGHNILSLRVTSSTPDGIEHKAVAKYVLQNRKPMNGI
jgi:hypothetical protein